MLSFHASSFIIINSLTAINSSPPGQNGRHFADNLFKCILVNEKFCISIRISLNFVPKGSMNNKSTLVQVNIGSTHVA